MKRNAGAQAGESKLESRFAALTSGLLARKGFAAPSNSPVADPAEETEAFSMDPAPKSSRAASAKPAPAKDAAPRETGKPAAQRKVETEPAPAKKAEAASKSKQELKLQQTDRAAPASITIINERSYEAGYPDNPTPEEIAALEAEADEVVSYFENFGSEDAAAVEKDDFYGNDEGEADVLDELDDLDDAEPPLNNTVPGPWIASSVPAVAANAAADVKAGVTVQLTAREFMRLSLGAAELQQSAQDLIVEAIEEYLDARGVHSLGGCSCLEALTKKPGDA